MTDGKQLYNMHSNSRMLYIQSHYILKSNFHESLPFLFVTSAIGWVRLMPIIDSTDFDFGSFSGSVFFGMVWKEN